MAIVEIDCHVLAEIIKHHKEMKVFLTDMLSAYKKEELLLLRLASLVDEANKKCISEIVEAKGGE